MMQRLIQAPLKRLRETQLRAVVAGVRDIYTPSRSPYYPPCIAAAGSSVGGPSNELLRGSIYARCLSSRGRSNKSSSSSGGKQRSYNYPKDPYQVLNVSRTATEKEIKMAYFKEAKKCHPDLNPGDPVANEKFQALSDAYQLLMDSNRRAQYDTYGSGYSNQASGRASAGGAQGDSQQSYQYESPEDMFRKVSEDVSILTEAFNEYVQDLQDEFTYAAECAGRGEWSEVFQIMRQNKEVVFVMILPIILLRFPFLIALFLRLGLAGSQVLFVGLVRSGNLQAASQMVWKKVLQLAIDRRNRKKR